MAELAGSPAGHLCGAVLCGGRSTRMGADKATLVVDGVPMARRVADALRASGADPVIAIGGDEPALEAAGLDVRPDRHPGEGPLGAVAQALALAGRPTVAVLACDLLRPDPAVIALVAERRAVADADVAVPVGGGRPQWAHAVWHRRAGGILDDVFAAGERSIVGATAGLRVVLVEVDDEGVLRDADRPEDLGGSRRHGL